MRTHSNDFKNAIKEYGRQFTDTIYYNNTTYNGDHIFSVNYSVDTSLFKSVMQTLTIDTDIPMNVGDTLDYGIRVVGVNDEMRFNKFIVNKIEDQKDKKSKLVTCYDRMINAMVDYKGLYNATTDTSFVDNKNYYLYDVSEEKYIRYKGSRTGNPRTLGLYQSAFPMTIRNFLIKICNEISIPYSDGSLPSYTNYQETVTKEHYVDEDGNSLGYTYRDVMDDIAEATGSFIYVDQFGYIQVRTFTNTQDTINEEFFNDKNVNIGKKVGPYNTLVLSRANDSDNIYRPVILPQNPIELKISDNPILEQDNRENFIDGIYNNINGLEFYLNDFTTQGVLYYQVGDKYNVSIDNTTYPCLMLSDNIKRTTGLKEIIHTNEPTTSVTDYKYSSTTDKVGIATKNAKILVDKANASIEQIVEAVGDDGEVTGASIIMAINDDESNLSLNADKININGVVSANGNFEIDLNGNMSCNNATINGGYLELTDDPDTYDDRLIIKKKNSTELTTATSEYVLTKKAQNDDGNYVQMSLYTGFSYMYTNNNKWWACGLDMDRLGLSRYENGTRYDLDLTADPNGTNIIPGNVSIGKSLTVASNINSLYRKQFTLTAKSSDDAPQHYLLATLPANSTGNFTSFTIEGHFGAFVAKTNFNIIVTNRDGIRVYGSYTGDPNAWLAFEFRIYTQSNNDLNIYLTRKTRYTSDVVLSLYGQQVTIYNSTTPVTPTGTLTRTYDGSGFPNVSHTRAGTGIVTRSSGATLVSSSWARYGNVCSVVISITATSNIGVGSNAFTGTINSSFIPKYKASGVTFNASSCLVGVIETNGNITIRVTGATFSNGNTADVSFTYVMN